MPDSSSIQILTGKLIIGILLFIRVLAFLISSSFYRTQGIPAQVKIFISVILSASLVSAFWNEQIVIDLHLWNLVYLVFKEFFVGLAIGFATNTIFWGARMAGGLIDFDMGFHTGTLFSQQDEAPTLVGELKYMITLMIFLVLNGHHYLIEGLYASVRAVPIGSFEITESTVRLMVRIATSVMIIGIKMASPVIVAIFLTNLALALLARVAPQTNIFILSFQLKIGIGLLVLFASIPLFIMVAKYSMMDMQSEIMRFLLTLNPARV